MDFASELNAEQRAAALHSDGAVLVSAGAGSGKTRVLTYHIADLLINKGVKAYNILAITFTNKAARELRERIDLKLSEKVEFLSDMWVLTFHSMCARILRQNIDRIGYNKNFSIYADDETDRVIKQIIKDKNMQPEGSKDEKLYKDAKYHISNCKSSAVDFSVYARDAAFVKGIDKIEEIYYEYEQRLKAANALDFDDLLLKTYELLTGDAGVLFRYQEKFKYIHVDEFQDTNGIQYLLVKLLGGLNKNIFVVGDEDQSIYGWRGAKFSNMQDFQKEYDAVLYKLTQNYRSTRNILNAANSVIANNTCRIEKELWTEKEEGVKPEYREEADERAEAEFAATTIKYLVRECGCKYRGFAVLTRINALSRAFEEKFMAYGIPYKVFGGFKFFERKEVKDVLSLLRIAVNPDDDEALVRAVGFLPLSIGAATVSQLRAYSGLYGQSLYKTVISIENNTELRPAIVKKVLPLSLLLKDITGYAARQEPETCFLSVVERAGVNKLYPGDDEENVSRRMNVEQLAAGITEFCRDNPGAGMSEYIQQIALYSDLDTMDDADYVCLATVHAVKGLEFDTVFVAGLEDKIFPVSRAMDNPGDLEEERRLLYVAITRARRRLYLTRAQTRFLYGVRAIALPSPFLKEVDGIKLKQREPAFNRNPGNWGRGYGGGYGGYSRNSEYEPGGYEPDYPTSGGAQKIEYKKDVPLNLVRAADLIKDTGKNFSAGDRVEHPKFGAGTILMIKDGDIADISFNEAGKKTLSLLFAPLKKI